MDNKQRKSDADWLEANVVMGNSNDIKIVRGIPGSYGAAELKDRRVLDIGAHIGSFSVYAAWKGAKSVTAVEPLPRNVAILRENAKNWPAIHVMEGAAVRDTSYHRVITCTAENKDTSNYGHSVLRRRTDFKNPRVAQFPVTMIKFEDLLKEEPQIIKMDCEGSEHELLKGYIAGPEVEALLMEVHFFSVGQSEMWATALSSLLEQGFKLVRGKPSIIEGYGQYGLITLLRR